MFIDLNHVTERGIELDQDIIFEEKYYKKSLVKSLEKTHVKGKIYYSQTGEVIFEGNVFGIMKLKDANSGELINYQFKTNVEEILAENNEIEADLKTNTQNSLDLKEVLWQNIVLEVPIKFSRSKQPNTLKGDGWELSDENSKKEDPRLECFKALLEKGKE